LHLPLGFLAGFGQRLKEILPVHLIEKNILLPVTPAQDMIYGPRILDS
jgi:hypothetical protein